MIGDSENDVVAGNNAGCKEAFLVNDSDKSLLDAVNKILV